MGHLASRVRIGEKIAAGFGLVILLFLGVITHDQLSHRRLTADLLEIQAVHGARQSLAFEIELRLHAMRIAEADFLATRDLQSAEEVAVQGAALEEAVRGLAAIDAPSEGSAGEIMALAQEYLQRFDRVVAAWTLRGLEPDAGLQGEFRAAAHDLEVRAEALGPGEGLSVDVLQLRRREKDYLLRGGDDYVAMVDDILAGLAERVSRTPLAATEHSALRERLATYGRAFHALVEQDRQIARLNAEMREAATRITGLVRDNALQANRLMASKTDQITSDAARQGRLNLGIASMATLLGVLFAFLITTRIVRPVRAIGRLLERLIHETPRERVPAEAGARDEIAIMAATLNTLADHKATFVHWWSTAMREAVALRDRYAAHDVGPCADAEDELRRAVDARRERLLEVCDRMSRHAGALERAVDQLNGAALSAQHAGSVRSAAVDLAVLRRVLEADAHGDSAPTAQP